VPTLARYPQSSIDNLQVLILLIDAHMIAAPAWRHWISGLSDSASKG
jgi:hypothetical protein